MRAKIVENINFKKTGSSREALNIGPEIIPSEILVELKKKWIEEYKDSLKILIGRRVKLETSPHPFISWSEKSEERIIVPKKIHHDANPEKNIISDFVIEDIEGNKYRVAGHKPIRILD